MEICAKCNNTFEDTEFLKTGERKPCTRCGSTARIINMSATITAVSVTPDNVSLLVDRSPPFSFGAVVTVERSVLDGQVIKLIDPIYSYLIEEIGRDPQIIYHIDPRKWEEIIAAAYDHAGFDEVILTPRSGDLGRDVIAIKKGFGSVKFIEQVKAYNPGHVVSADEVRTLLGVLQAEQDATKAIFTTTSTFAPKIKDDRLIKPFLPYRLELIDKEKLVERLLNLKT